MNEAGVSLLQAVCLLDSFQSDALTKVKHSCHLGSKVKGQKSDTFLAVSFLLLGYRESLVNQNTLC